MKTIETIYDRYGEARRSPTRNTQGELLAYDFFRLLDATWSLKNSMEQFSDKVQRLGTMIKYDHFGLILVCSRYISESIAAKSANANFLECWILFRAILEKMLNKGEELNNELALSLARLLFITALIFNMPKKENVENIVSNPNTRPPNGLFLASTDDIEFSKTLPGDLKGPFESESDVLINLKKNLQYYHDKI